MNPARLADLHRERAALHRRLAVVEEQIAEELTPRDDAPSKPPRPSYAPAGPVTDRDRAVGARTLRGKGYSVRGTGPAGAGR